MPWDLIVVSCNERVIRVTSNSDKQLPSVKHSPCCCLGYSFYSKLNPFQLWKLLETPRSRFTFSQALQSSQLQCTCASRYNKMGNWLAWDSNLEPSVCCVTVLSLLHGFPRLILQCARSTAHMRWLMVPPQSCRVRSVLHRTPIKPSVQKQIHTLKQCCKQMAEFHISIPDGNILIEQPPVQGISRLRSNSKFFLVFGR